MDKFYEIFNQVSSSDIWFMNSYTTQQVKMIIT